MNTIDTFFQYLKPLGSSLKTKRTLAVSIVAFFSPLVGIIDYLLKNDLNTIFTYLRDAEFLAFLFYSNITLFLIICVWLLLQKPPKQIFYNITKLHDFDNPNNKEVSLLNFISKQKGLEKRFKRANDSVKDFMKWFKYVWLGWFLLYAVTFCFSFDIDFYALQSVLVNTTNNLASLFFFLCLVVLNQIAFEGDDETYKVKIAPKWYLLFGIIIVAEIALHIALPQNQPFIAKSFAIVSGLLAMISMSLLLGRLDSKLIDKLPMGILVVLYGYAGIQLFLPYFLEQDSGFLEGESTLSINLIGIMYLALFCKVVLLIFIFWILDTNRLFFYFLAVYRIHDNIHSEWNKIKDAFLSKSKNPAEDLSGKWKVYEYYFSEKSYGGFVTGEFDIKLFQGEYTGEIILEDNIQPENSGSNSASFLVSQGLKVKKGANKKIVFQGNSPKILKRTNVKIKDEEYDPDQWIGIQIDDDTIIGASQDPNNIKGNFCFKRMVIVDK